MGWAAMDAQLGWDVVALDWRTAQPRCSRQGTKATVQRPSIIPQFRYSRRSLRRSRADLAAFWAGAGSKLSAEVEIGTVSNVCLVVSPLFRKQDG